MNLKFRKSLSHIKFHIHYINFNTFLFKSYFQIFHILKGFVATKNSNSKLVTIDFEKVFPLLIFLLCLFNLWYYHIHFLSILIPYSLKKFGQFLFFIHNSALKACSITLIEFICFFTTYISQFVLTN